jgi:glycosyltransferase 2 family protein
VTTASELSGLPGAPPSEPGQGEVVGLKHRSWLIRWMPRVAAVALLALTASRVDLGAAAERLGSTRLPWLVLAFALSALPILLSAWRWRYTAGRLGLPIAWGWAWREYYVSLLLNQVLPGGVLGDVLRAMRHRRSLGVSEARGAVVNAVVFERASNQFVVWGWAIALGPIWVGKGAQAWPGWPWAAAAVALLAGAMALGRGRLGATGAWAGRAASLAWRDGRRVFVQRGSGFAHVAVSALIFVLFGAVFWCASAATGAPLDLAKALRIIPLVLAASTLPLTPSGWGVREVAAAALYGAEGLSPAAGAAASVAYGLVSLAATLPGAIFLAFPHGQRPRARP